MTFNVLFNDGLKFFGNAIAFEGNGFFTVNINWGYRNFASAGQTDANIGMFALTRTIHHTTHHRFFRNNYGLFFTFWDQWMGPEKASFEDDYNRIFSNKS